MNKLFFIAVASNEKYKSYLYYFTTNFIEVWLIHNPEFTLRNKLIAIYEIFHFLLRPIIFYNNSDRNRKQYRFSRVKP